MIAILRERFMGIGTKYIELTFKCKRCGFVQEFTYNPNYPLGRITCQNCNSIIKRKTSERKPEQKAVLLSNKYNTWCRKCKKWLRVGIPVYWTPGKRGVLCESCNSKNKEPVTLDYKKHMEKINEEK